MAPIDRAFNAIRERCRLALRIKFQRGVVYQAEPLLAEEFRLIQHHRFEEALVQIVEFGDQLRQHGHAFHVIGSGGSSVILFLLGISEVDPVIFDTHFQRLWCTTSGEPPMVTFVVLPVEGDSWKEQPTFGFFTAHPMTALETLPELLDRQFPDVSFCMNDKAVFATIQAGDTEGVFGLDSEPVRSLLTQVRPSRIKSLATVTALAHIAHHHPKVVSDFLNILDERANDRTKNLPGHRNTGQRLPILFQEVIMSQLHRKLRIPWDKTYRTVQMAAKRKAESLEQLCGTLGLAEESEDGELLEHLIEASTWAVCRAHHAANAITSYRAACYRTFHRQAFEDTLQAVLQQEQVT